MALYMDVTWPMGSSIAACNVGVRAALYGACNISDAHAGLQVLYTWVRKVWYTLWQLNAWSF